MTPGPETHHLDRKSLRKVTGSAADFDELARDCVCFANGAGGVLLIGIEDGADVPSPDQHIDPGLLDRLRKRVGELTVNVQVLPELKRHENGGEYVSLTVPRSVGVASTTDGRYFARIGDCCRPVVGDDVLRLADERPGAPWESMTSLGVPSGDADAAKVGRLCAALRASDRVKPSVKEKVGRTKGTRYFVPPALLREAGLDTLTTLSRVQPHRLRALILEDLERFPDSGRADIQRRIGPEIRAKTISRMLDLLLDEGAIEAFGERRWRRYRLHSG